MFKIIESEVISDKTQAEKQFDTIGIFFVTFPARYLINGDSVVRPDA